MAAKEMLNNEVRITVLRALMGLLMTASLAAGSAYMAMRDQVVRSEEWIKLVGVQIVEQNKKLDAMDERMNGMSRQINETRESVARIEGALSIK